MITIRRLNKNEGICHSTEWLIKSKIILESQRQTFKTVGYVNSKNLNQK